MSGPRRFALLHDGGFTVCVAEELCPLVDGWLPLNRQAIDGAPAPHGSHIDVERDDAPFPRDADASETVLLRLGDVTAYTRGDDAIALRGPGAGGLVQRARTRARIGVHGGTNPVTLAPTVYSMLTLTAALLLARSGAALVHAGAVADQQGRAWLFAGDTHAGKTTTCVSLADAGWRFLTDDQVVLRMGAGGTILTEGWPRRAHLDAGYQERAIAGHRVPVDLRERWDTPWCGRASLFATVLPSVRPEVPTAARRVPASEAFTALVRQSPWLLADGVSAPAIVALLRAVALCPAFALDLGLDSYANGSLLASVLSTALERR